MQPLSTERDFGFDIYEHYSLCNADASLSAVRAAVRFFYRGPM